jgi:hypothetical protein
MIVVTLFTPSNPCLLAPPNVSSTNCYELHDSAREQAKYARHVHASTSRVEDPSLGFSRGQKGMKAAMWILDLPFLDPAKLSYIQTTSGSGSGNH